MARLVLDGVTKTYAGDVLGVEDINLELQDRELVVIVGPSGCGKTTILRLIAGLEQLTRGEIRIGAEAVNSWRPHQRNVAMVFQDFPLYPHLTVHWNLVFGSVRPNGDLRGRVASVVESLRLGPLLERYPRQLSGGERQRVAIGRAIVRDPAVFLLDEPFSGLDEPLRLELRQEIVRSRDRVQAPILLVTHSQADALSLGDRIVVMNAGRIQQVGGPDELYDRPASRFVAGFIGMPPMNFLDSRLVIRDGDAVAEYAGTPLPIPRALAERWVQRAGNVVTIGVRADAITCTPASQSGNRGRLSGRVEASDRTGAERSVWVRVGEQSFVCRTDAATRLGRGEPVELAIDMTRCLAFDSLGRNVALGIELSSPGG